MWLRGSSELFRVIEPSQGSYAVTPAPLSVTKAGIPHRGKTKVSAYMLRSQIFEVKLK